MKWEMLYMHKPHRKEKIERKQLEYKARGHDRLDDTQVEAEDDTQHWFSLTTYMTNLLEDTRR